MVAFARHVDQSWTLDGLGNFAEFDNNGSVQTREVNAANEIQSISGSWVDPTYDNAGNMISGPKPGEEETKIHYVYDAWNRLVKVQADDEGEPGEVIAEYECDGQNRRVEKITSAQTRHYYLSDQNQVLEVRVDTSTNAENWEIGVRAHLDISGASALLYACCGCVEFVVLSATDKMNEIVCHRPTYPAAVAKRT